MKIYRDILLFPKFKNIDKIQNIRKKCDKLYNVIEPHITIVFPFLDDISDEELIIKVKKLIEDKKRFNIKFRNTSYSDDDYIFLNCVEGKEYICELHDLIYNSLLKKHLLNKEYIPHITIGQKGNCKDYNDISNLNDIFECTIDKVYIEKIGENQESIILAEVDLK